jgi:uncharacterized protein (TIGR02266 family)
MNVRTTDLREHPRSPVSFWAVEENENAAYYHFVRDLSEGGLFLEKQMPLPVGTPLVLVLSLPDGETIRTQAKVVHVRQEPPRMGNGVKFNDMTSEHRNALAGYLAQISGVA